MSGHSGHHHDHHLGAAEGDRRALLAVAINMLLTVAQAIGGILSGSLALIADALHNFSDALSLAIAYAARRIARRPANERMTFGYGRAEVVAALVNYTTLIVLGLYLVIEAILRLLAPEPVQGWLIVAIAGVALVVDAATAVLTYAMSKRSMNFRAAFLHNVADALGSVGVIVAGVVIILYDWRLIDPIVTLMIAGYVLWHALSEIGGAIRLLMLAAPPGINVQALIAALRGVDGVAEVHHVHLWAIDEQQISLEAHVVVADGTGREADAIRHRIRALCRERFGIGHATLEVEHASARCEGEDAMVVGHRNGAAPVHRGDH